MISVEENASSSVIDNLSGVVGATVTDALNTLAAAVGSANILLYSQEVESASIIIDGSEEIFAGSEYDIPLNTLALGDVIIIEGGDDVACAATTLTQRLRVGGLGGDLVYAFAPQANGTKNGIRARGIVTATGAAGSIEWYSDPIPNSMAIPPARATTVVDTTADIKICMTGQWSANDAGNDAKSFMFNVYKFSK